MLSEDSTSSLRLHILCAGCADARAVHRCICMHAEVTVASHLQGSKRQVETGMNCNARPASCPIVLHHAQQSVRRSTLLRLSCTAQCAERACEHSCRTHGHPHGNTACQTLFGTRAAPLVRGSGYPVLNQILRKVLLRFVDNRHC